MTLSIWVRNALCQCCDEPRAISYIIGSWHEWVRVDRCVCGDLGREVRRRHDYLDAADLLLHRYEIFQLVANAVENHVLCSVDSTTYLILERVASLQRDVNRAIVGMAPPTHSPPTHSPLRHLATFGSVVSAAIAYHALGAIGCAIAPVCEYVSDPASQRFALIELT